MAGTRCVRRSYVVRTDLRPGLTAVKISATSITEKRLRLKISRNQNLILGVIPRIKFWFREILKEMLNKLKKTSINERSFKTCSLYRS